MSNTDFILATLKSWENGERLLEDSQELLDYERYPSAFALSILAQEEFSKSFIFNLITKKIIPWHPFVKRAIQDHSSKQLVGLVLDHLNPDIEDILNYFADGSYDESYKKAIDAINLLRFEKFDRWESNRWDWGDDPEFHKEAENILKGKLDKEKQDSIYVRVNKNGEVVFDPLEINKEKAEKMYERAKRFSYLMQKFVKEKEYEPFDYKKIEDAFKFLFNKYNGI